MKICHVCSAEVSDEFELCPQCGAQIAVMQEQETAEVENETIINNPCLAASVGDMVTAEIYCDVLTQNGISYSCDEGAMRIAFGGGFVAFDIYVDESQLESAQALYEQVLNSEPQFEDFDGEIAEDEE